MVKPWERQQGESPQAFEAFAAYRDLGADRSYEEVGRQLGKSGVLMGRWAKTWKWYERVLEFDRYTDDQERAERLRTRRAMVKRHANIAQLLQQKAIEAITKLPPDAVIRAADITRMFDVAARVERIAVGLPAEGSEGLTKIELIFEEREEDPSERVGGIAGGVSNPDLVEEND